MSEFKAIKITERVYWVGAIDWALRDFHGYSTSRGSTYNAYLILGDEPILVDTVKAPFFSEMLARIKSIIDPKKIKYIISNHAEMDHSGALPELLKIISPEKIFASKAGVKTLQDHFHFENVVITPVNNGENLTLGNINLNFLETKMLHWPESMFTYFSEEGVLFSQDAFGMHFATHELFGSHCELSVLREEAAKYFANILMPYSALVLNLFKTLQNLNLSIKTIAPVHGPIWDTEEGIKWILDLWKKWAEQNVYQKVVIVYATMWQSTARMATAIADGIAATNPTVQVKVLPLINGVERSDVAMELLEAGALIVGSPTLNQQIFPTVADILCYLKGLKRKNLIGQVFGSYGWGNEGVKILREELQKMGIMEVAEPVSVRYVPTASDLQSCFDLGKNIALTLRNIKR